MVDIPMTDTELNEAPKQMVGQKDKFLNETITYIGSVDEQSVRKQQKIDLTIIALSLLPAIINPLVIIVFCIVIPRYTVLESTHTFQIKYVKDVDCAAGFIRQQIVSCFDENFGV